MLNIHAPKEELIRAMDACLIESILYEEDHPGVDVVKFNEVIVLNSRIHSADMNGVFLASNRHDDILPYLLEAKKYFLEKMIPYYWWVGKHRNTALRDMLEEIGYTHVADLPVMIYDLEKLPKPAGNPDIQCRKVLTLDELNTWSDISSICLEMTTESCEEYRNYCFHHNLKESGKQELYLAYWKGIPAASCMLFKGTDIATLYFIATLPEYRNRNLGRAVTLHAMHRAKEEGYLLAGLQATSMGMSLYENIGFTTISTEFIYANA